LGEVLHTKPEYEFPHRVIWEWQLRGAFHSTKNSGLKFRAFPMTNGTVFSGLLNQPVPGHHVPSFERKYKQENKVNVLASFVGVVRQL